MFVFVGCFFVSFCFVFVATLVMPVDKGMEAYENTSLNIVLVDLYSSGKNGIQSKGEV